MVLSLDEVYPLAIKKGISTGKKPVYQLRKKI
jgi:hypothetical protein